MFCVVAYDIADDRRREKIASELENFGVRVQRSVFECHLTPAQVQDLQQRLDALLVWQDDKIRYYTLCQKDVRRIAIDGPGEVTQDRDYVVV